ncbi:Glu/Leu/Phe/Val dehydrogenase [Novosphingobium sp. Gsoil 351]|uniref:Glu/Leu/Phe/Val dehydrogenase n=1 Tax=Novosphingobium sp. Gsoil 351 TaxID=2675225 RepID=UPI0018A866B6|nr:Glu/Leu/Phe/Val dehydrogenase [Novosphingobium sp. Gsoil 351]
MEPFDTMARTTCKRVLLLQDHTSGLQAAIALDSLTLGPALGGIRTQPYPDFAAALADAQRLASAMTLKNAIAGLPGGGGKTVVIDHPGLDRRAAFARLGQFIEDLGGLYRAAGDLGTTHQDLLAAASVSRFVNTSGQALGDATGQGVVACMRAVARTRGKELADLTVAIQGCGLIGSGVARELKRQGAKLIVADLDENAARRLGAELGAGIVAAEQVLTVPCDIVSPCAIGGVITPLIVSQLAAWAICGGANNQLAELGAAEELAQRGIIFVPDFLASAGAVIVGATQSLMDGADPQPLISRLGATTATIIAEAEASARTTVEVATEIARKRIAAEENAA